ncbi:hypothetical protein HZB89_00445 [archaeon]|nr:hypothetical protein [archaeon]
MALILQLVLVSLVLFSYFIHLLLMRRFINQRPIINSFKTHFFAIMFVYFSIKWIQLASNELFADVPRGALGLLFDELYFALTVALALLVLFNAFSAGAITEFINFIKNRMNKGDEAKKGVLSGKD